MKRECNEKSDGMDVDIFIEPISFNNADHLNALVELINDYIDDEMGGGTPIKGVKALHLVDGLNNQQNAVLLLASIETVPVGLLVAFETFATFTVKKCLNVHDIIVKKKYRGLGVGRKLMEEVLDEAKNRNCSKVTLEVREDNAVAQNLYKSLGFGECDPPMKFWVKKIESIF